jgi:Coenzyme PQQ synthesis protein D (PqqD)
MVGWFTLRPGLEWRELDGEVVALETGQSIYVAANPSGTLLWRRLSAGTTREELADALVHAYGIGADAAARDVDAFLRQARDLQLVDER